MSGKNFLNITAGVRGALTSTACVGGGAYEMHATALYGKLQRRC